MTPAITLFMLICGTASSSGKKKRNQFHPNWKRPCGPCGTQQPSCQKVPCTWEFFNTTDAAVHELVLAVIADGVCDVNVLAQIVGGVVLDNVPHTLVGNPEEIAECLYALVMGHIEAHHLPLPACPPGTACDTNTGWCLPLPPPPPGPIPAQPVPVPPPIPAQPVPVPPPPTPPPPPPIRPETIPGITVPPPPPPKPTPPPRPGVIPGITAVPTTPTPPPRPGVIPGITAVPVQPPTPPPRPGAIPGITARPTLPPTQCPPGYWLGPDGQCLPMLTPVPIPARPTIPSIPYPVDPPTEPTFPVYPIEPTIPAPVPPTPPVPETIIIDWDIWESGREVEDGWWPRSGTFMQVVWGDRMLGEWSPINNTGSDAQGEARRSIPYMTLLSDAFMAAKDFGGLSDAEAGQWARDVAYNTANQIEYINLIQCVPLNDALYGTYGWLQNFAWPAPSGRAMRLRQLHYDNKARIVANMPWARNLEWGVPADQGTGNAFGIDPNLRSYAFIWLPAINREILWQSGGTVVTTEGVEWEDGTNGIMPPQIFTDFGFEGVPTNTPLGCMGYEMESLP